MPLSENIFRNNILPIYKLFKYFITELMNFLSKSFMRRHQSLKFEKLSITET